VVGVSGLFLVAAAFLAGVVSFSSPCCLPLLPGYVAYVSGGTGDRQHARRTMLAAGLFTVGFGLTFTALGASASWIGAALLASRPGLIRAAGALVVAVGLLVVVGAEPRLLVRERRLLALHRVPQGPLFAAPLGAAFALGWTPCIGPVLAGLLTAAAATSTVGVGAGLLAVYSAGLAVPFLLLAWAVAHGRRRSGGAAGLLGRHHRLLARMGGTLLVAMGLAMVAGWWTQLFAPLLRWFARSGWPPI
jgi:cytochrome c-type biogenesis protein